MAEHIKTAFTAPGSAKPANRAKYVVGQSPAVSLNRLYYDNAGNLLGQFMALNRIIDGKNDGSYVTIS
ncbi:hypothetical protein [Streptomyces sp. NPDC056194]|uniref:hypothetical protein n=1 Tax=unclassified Streptomyces TaxID=2593676 RepID=UPI0035DCC5E6